MLASLRSSASRARQWAGASINRAGYLRKWLTLGIAIGIIAGIGAVVFYLALDYAGRFLLGYLADYQIPQAKGDGGGSGSPATPGHGPSRSLCSAGPWCRRFSWPNSRPRPKVTAPTAPLRRYTPTLGESAAARSW